MGAGSRSQQSREAERAAHRHRRGLVFAIPLPARSCRTGKTMDRALGMWTQQQRGWGGGREMCWWNRSPAEQRRDVDA